MSITARDSHLGINSMMGYIDFNRNLYYCRRCEEGFAPFDKELDVNDEHRITKNLTETVCDLAQRMSSFKEAEEVLHKYLNIKASHSTIQKISEKVGRRLYEKEKSEAEETYENQHQAIGDIPDHEKRGRIYIEADGSMVLIRGKGWKEIKLGMVFKDETVLNRKRKRHIITEKDYVVSLGSAEEFKKMLLNAAIKNGYGRAKEVIILGDGAKWIWNAADELFPDATFILDYYHFEEHVYECANIIYPEYELARRRWAKVIIDGFMDNKIAETIENIRPEEYTDLIVKEEVKRLKTYLENNHDKMKYKEYISKGYFIGSGAIESGHKHV
ncbi:MAG: hypothetical protein GX974_03410, partial [Clostridiales bacterium]|nr:hypothetical protein [Clostridiales bacterium]